VVELEAFALEHELAGFVWAIATEQPLRTT
jgi:hypothetical protein